jgi:putative transposase
MECIAYGSAAVSERSARTAQGYRRFRSRACGKPFNERSDGIVNRTKYPSDVIALVVLWRLRYKLALRDLPEMFLIRGIVFSRHVVFKGSGHKFPPAFLFRLPPLMWGVAQGSV